MAYLSFWIFFAFARHWYFPTQAKQKVIGGILLSLMGLLPSLWWNLSHDWATFRHVSATLQGGSGAQASANLLEFLGAQALLISPILFVLLVLGFKQWFKQRKELSPPLFFCGFVTLTLLASASLMACFQKVQGNWMVIAYPTSFIILGWYCFEQFPQRVKWIKIGIALSIALTSLLLILPLLYTRPELSTYAIGYRLNPLKHNMGWSALQQGLKERGYQADRHFLVSDKYQTSSLLSFYNEGQKRAYFLNLLGIRNNQFSYWPSLQEEQTGKTGYFIFVENTPQLQREGKLKQAFYEQELQRYFEKVESLEIIPLVYEGPVIAKAAFVFRCEDCKNLPISHSSLY